ncbi:MAG TPA: hypothetical protein VM324_08625 [Egibacteraceae bacterium]|nr:hypothetical protein [Egibacteraceae bacterium]
MTAADTTTVRDEEARYEAMDAFLAQLKGRLSDHTGSPLVHAHADLTDMLADVLAVLYDSDRDTAAPGNVVAFVDDALAVLRSIRDEAVAENRRRLDAAMERSAKLLGLDEDGEGTR